MKTNTMGHPHSLCSETLHICAISYASCEEESNGKNALDEIEYLCISM